MADDKKAKLLTVDADKFDAILKRFIEHKPVPKRKVRAVKFKKLKKILPPTN